MWNELKKRFIQVSLSSIIWIMLITTFSNMHTKVSYLYFWRILLIGCLFGLVFGVVYHYLWSYSNLFDNYKVLLSSVANFICIVTTVKLYSNYIFSILIPYLFYIFIITFILHLIIFKIYLRFQNARLVNELEKLR